MERVPTNNSVQLYVHVVVFVIGTKAKALWLCKCGVFVMLATKYIAADKLYDYVVVGDYPNGV